MEIIVDVKELEEKALDFANRMYGPDDPRKEACAARFFREEYRKMTEPPSSSILERVEGLLVEVRDLLKHH